MEKVGQYYYERTGTNYAIYVVEKIVPADTVPDKFGIKAGPTIHSRKVETHFDPEAARRRVYELNGWKNYKPLKAL